MRSPGAKDLETLPKISSVFDDGQAIAAAQRQELDTALTAHSPARRVVVRRDGIEDAIAYI